MQPSAPSAPTRGHPSFSHWLFHVRKTVHLYTALLRDGRVPLIRKILFIATIIIFGVVLIIPDSLITAALAAILPVAGPVLGVPAGITADVAALAFVLYWLLRFFPAALVQEHAVELYGPFPDIRPHTANQVAPGAVPAPRHRVRSFLVGLIVVVAIIAGTVWFMASQHIGLFH